MQEQKEKALQLSRNLEKAKAGLPELETAKEYVNFLYSAGAAVHHKKYGKWHYYNGCRWLCG